MGYLPTVIALRAKELTLEGRVLHNVVIGGSREGQFWRGNLDADELNGYVEYRQPTGAGAGRLYARLARLVHRRVGRQRRRDPARAAARQPAGARRRRGRLRAARQEAGPAGDRRGQPRCRHGGARRRRSRVAPEQAQPQHARGGVQRHRQLGCRGCAGRGCRRAPAGPATGRRATAHGHEVPARHRRLRPVAGALRHEGRGAAWQGPHGGTGGLARLAAVAGLSLAGRQPST